MNQRRKESLQAEIALYSDLKRLVESGIPPEPSTAFPVDPQTVQQVHRTLNHWTERVMHEVDDLPITEGQKLEVKATLTTADAIRAYVAAYPRSDTTPRERKR